jgi:hypothetical protein
MKKFIVLTLILCMTSLAAAALSIGVNGDPDPVDSEIAIFPSDSLMLDIRADGDVGYLYFMLIVDNAAGTITGPPSGYYWPYYIPGPGYYLPPNHNGIAGMIGGPDPVSIFGVVIDVIDFHAAGPDDALIELWTSLDTAYWAIADTITVHVPEPITLTLLGLGALLVRKRAIRGTVLF